MALIEARRVHKFFGQHHVLRGIDLAVERGEVLCILGPSGSGKSTFLRCINHLVPIDGGVILFDGETVGYEMIRGRPFERRERDVCLMRQRIGMVFQQFNLFAHLTAVENVSVGLVRVHRESRREARAHAQEMLARVGLSDRADAYPSQLSGGQQQRVAIARALAMHPEVMLFDEPTSALDPELVGEVLAVMKDVAASGMTMLIVTHETGFARDVADRLVVIDEGVVIEDGPTDVVLESPSHPRTAQFLRHIA